jgi:hypothetical protein
MNKNEILVGRQVGKEDFIVDEQYKSVGRKHARIIRKPDGIYIEDLDSAHGTFVNGKSVKLKKVSVNDCIFLGGIDCFELNLEKVFALLPISESDFKNGFLRLKTVYDDYLKEKNQLESKGQADAITKRMLPTMVLGSISTVLVFAGHHWVGVAGAVLSIVVFLVANKKSTKSNLKMKEQLNQLNEDFELNYICPACGMSLKGKSWELHKKQSKCPSCRREWNID